MTPQPAPAPRTAYLWERARRGYHAAQHGPSQNVDACKRGLCPEMAEAAGQPQPPNTRLYTVEPDGKEGGM